MTNQKILENLYNLKKELKTKELYPLTLKNLINEVKENVIKENLPETTSKKQYNAIKKFLNQKHLQCRPILQYTHIENSMQIFTDSYMLFRFHSNYIIEQLPKTTDQTGYNLPQYPKTNELCEPIFNSLLETVSYLVSDLKKEIKTAESFYIDIVLNESQKSRLDKKRLTFLIDILGLKNNQRIKFKYLEDKNNKYNVRPVAIVNEWTEGLLLPCRVNEE